MYVAKVCNAEKNKPSFNFLATLKQQSSSSSALIHLNKQKNNYKTHQKICKKLYR